MKVIIDPEDDIQYMSFYIKGLGDGRGAVKERELPTTVEGKSV